MSIQKEDFLTLASELCVGTAETHWRSAVSRAYYAAYHGCNDWHDALPMPGSNSGPNGGVHQKLINRLRNPDTTVPATARDLSKILGTKLDVLRGQRGKADYQLPETVDIIQAQNAYELATVILSKL